jgi:hypothetical protein
MRRRVKQRFVMPGLVPGIHVLLSSMLAKDVDGRDIRAFTPVFAGYARL